MLLVEFAFGRFALGVRFAFDLFELAFVFPFSFSFLFFGFLGLFSFAFVDVFEFLFSLVVSGGLTTSEASPALAARLTSIATV